MKISHIVVRAMATGALGLASATAAQSPTPPAPSSVDEGTAQLAAAASGEGPCHFTEALKENEYRAGKAIGPGRYLFYARPDASYDIELVGAGGSGGGTTMGTGHMKWGGGGRAGTVKRWLQHKLEPGVYLLEVGAGGAAVQGSRSWRDFGTRSVSGNSGGGTAIKRCSSGFSIIAAAGGAGGAGDSYRISDVRAGQRAERGQDLIDPDGGTKLGTGGDGGQWQRNGAAGTGVGAGGGGQGGYDNTTKRSGAGADGQARIVGL